MMLIIGDNQLCKLQDKQLISGVTGQELSKYQTFTTSSHLKKSFILQHEDHINAIMQEIKPGLLSICTKKYNQDILYKYFYSVKFKDVTCEELPNKKTQDPELVKVIPEVVVQECSNEDDNEATNSRKHHKI